ncbi:hypothetical protein DERP_005301 [Dermatophagoides pteronyssinus]|uniref:Uncharacterized protein n=1 Tax=Dermatophagoides pteronyssinus TaxID=6956 RepID=A0ABQ8JMQ4_DERPT|nr:hypothetical protein DERP_005301 [Dermatophagoides pteronyssinus]
MINEEYDDDDGDNERFRVSCIKSLLAFNISSLAACCSFALRIISIDEPATKSSLIPNADFNLSLRLRFISAN